MDGNARLLGFTENLEAACVGVVESGKMTKDLALLIHGPKYCQKDIVLKVLLLYLIFIPNKNFHVLCRVTRSQYLNTEDFIDAVAEELRARLFTKAKL